MALSVVYECILSSFRCPFLLLLPSLLLFSLQFTFSHPERTHFTQLSCVLLRYFFLLPLSFSFLCSFRLCHLLIHFL